MKRAVLNTNTVTIRHIDDTLMHVMLAPVPSLRSLRGTKKQKKKVFQGTSGFALWHLELSIIVVIFKCHWLVWIGWVEDISLLSPEASSHSCGQNVRLETKKLEINSNSATPHATFCPTRLQFHKLNGRYSPLWFNVGLSMLRPHTKQGRTGTKHIAFLICWGKH